MTDSTMAIIQASAFYEHNLPCPQNNVHQNPKSPEKPAKNFTMSNSSSVSSPSSSSSNALGSYQQMANYSLSEETDHPVISFKPDYGDYVQTRGPLLSFEQNEHVKRNLYPKMMSHDEYPIWDEELQPSSGMQFAWMNDQMGNSTITDCIQTHEGSNNKRPFMGESMQAVKKQCGVSKKQAKEKSLSPAKDPQSLAAKNRRERISERLKVLQDLVPNGSKVDLVTMLEKATSYVKFLQLQVKVLATDEFWPAQGGKAPELSQVREAIDNILASHQRDTNSSSK